MTALTFSQALVKYRSDQARDGKGRFADEGKGRGAGATEAMAGTARELDHLLVTRYKRKPPAAAAALRAELQRLGTKVPAFKGGNRQLFREWLLGAVQLAGREKIMNAGLNTRPGSGSDFVDASGGRESPRTTPQSFWTYQPGSPTPKLDQAIAIGAIHPKSTWQDWEALSPGMRREIVREATKQIERFASRLNEALKVNDEGKTFAGIMSELRASKPNLARLHAIGSAFWGYQQPKPRSLAAGYRNIQRRMDSLNNHRRAAASIGNHGRLAG